METFERVCRSAFADALVSVSMTARVGGTGIGVRAGIEEEKEEEGRGEKGREDGR